MSLKDYARSQGAGPPQTPLIDLKNDVVRRAIDWDELLSNGVATARENLKAECALHSAVKRYKAVLGG